MGEGAPRDRDPHSRRGLQARPGKLGRSSEARSERRLGREPDTAQQVVPARVGAERLVAERGLTISSGVDGELRGADRIAVSVRLRSHEAADG